MKTSVKVKLQTGYFERTPCRLKAVAEGVAFKPSTKGGGEISISAASIKSVTFYEANLKMEIQTDCLTEAYFANENDWLDAMRALREVLGMKITCEMN